jgi:hypothetical protein
VPDTAEHSLSNISLRWMIQELMRSDCGVLFDFAAFDRWDIPQAIVQQDKCPSGTTSDNGPGAGGNAVDAPDAVEKIHDQLKRQPLWWILEILPLKYVYQDDDGKWHSTRW